MTLLSRIFCLNLDATKSRSRAATSIKRTESWSPFLLAMSSGVSFSCKIFVELGDEIGENLPY
jgi:hypothetical protein